jgi:hypothetical protein
MGRHDSMPRLRLEEVMVKSVAEMLKEAEVEAPEWPKTIYESLIRAQMEMTHAKLDGVNPAFKSRYATLGSTIDAVRPALNKYGIFVSQEADSGDNGVRVRTILTHHSGETMMTTWTPVGLDKTNAHGYGSAFSYARRYSLQMACGIFGGEDDDGNIAAQNAPKGAAAQAIEGVKIDRELRDKYIIEIRECIATDDAQGWWQLADELDDPESQDLKIAIWTGLNSKERSQLKAWSQAKEI